jgi:peptide/nickel transport system permease protein
MQLLIRAFNTVRTKEVSQMNQLSNPVVNNQIQVPEEEKEYKIENRFLVIWRRYKKNKAAVLGLIIFSFFALVAIFAPWLAPHDPYTYDLYDSS